MKSFEEALTDLLIIFPFGRCTKYIKALGFSKQYQLSDNEPLEEDDLRYYIVNEFRRIYQSYSERLKSLEVITVSTGRFMYKIYYNEESGHALYLGFVPLDADTCD
jgi:hypothetical protein